MPRRSAAQARALNPAGRRAAHEPAAGGRAGRGPGVWGPRGRGFTLVELLVVLGLLVLLGGGLVAMLRQGVRAWRAGEARRAAYEEAQAVLRQLADDLRHAFTAALPVRGELPLARLIADFDARGRQRLVLVRTLPGAGRQPLLQLAGVRLGASAWLDGSRDREEAFAGALLPTGGLLEVAYAMDPDGGTELRRGYRSPVGGPDSLFTAAVLDDPARLRAATTPLGTQVLHLGLWLWTPHTRDWQEPGAGGPARIWDSTRGLVPPQAGAEAGFSFGLGPASLREPSDDMFPERVRIELVVAEPPPAGAWSVLQRPLDPGEGVLYLEDARPFRERLPWVRVGTEWIRCRYRDAQSLEVEPGGRGRRGTAPQAHPALTEVVSGHTFVLDVELPQAREPWPGR